MAEPLEDEIARLIIAGDHAAAAAALLKGYGAEIFGYLVGVLHEDDTADEAFAEFSHDLWKGITGFRRDCSARTFAYKLAWHAALRIAQEPFRRRRRRLDSYETAALVAGIRSETPPHLRTGAKDRLSELRRSLATEEQSLLILRIDRKLSWREVAAVLSLDEAAVRKRFERTKDKLRTLARKNGMTGG